MCSQGQDTSARWRKGCGDVLTNLTLVRAANAWAPAFDYRFPSPDGVGKSRCSVIPWAPGEGHLFYVLLGLGEKVTLTGACFTVGSRSATALWMCSADSSFKQSSNNLLHLLTISLVMYATLLLTTMSHVLHHEGQNPFLPLFCLCTYTSNQLNRCWFCRARSEEEERERR